METVNLCPPQDNTFDSSDRDQDTKGIGDCEFLEKDL